MGGKHKSFYATDAFAYVDTYRRGVLNHASRIEGEKERLEEKMWQMNIVPSRLWAEWRAYVHALAFVNENQDPSLVYLGPDDEVPEEVDGDPAQAIAGLREELEGKEDEIEELTKKVSRAKELEQDYQVELVRKNQEINKLNRRLTQTYASIYIITATMTVITLILLAVRFLR